MYEYRCSNESCNKVWTINEGGIGTLYLTCPYCGKGQGKYIRQIKENVRHEDIEQIVRKRAESNTSTQDINSNINSNLEQHTQKQIEAEKVNKVLGEIPITNDESKQQIACSSESEVSKAVEREINISKEKVEDDIFERIKKKRQIEEEFRKDCAEDVDILEISGGSIQEIEGKIKEFEEYYYIEVLDRNIQQQGRRFNCIIKYRRK